MPFYDWSTTNTATASTSAVSSGPTLYTTTAPIVTFSTSVETYDERIKEYCEKVDQHVDKLEEDIEFLNTERLELQKTVADQHAQIDILKTELQAATDKLNSLEGLVHWIEDHVNVEVNI